MNLNIFCFSLIISISIYQLQAQNKNDSLTIDDYYIDFAIPDLSAYSLLNISPDNINKPRNIKELSFTLLNINKDGKINPGVGVEWSPLYSLKDELKNVKEYQKNYLLYALQLSSATNVDDEGAKLAFSFKWTPIDNTNPLLSNKLGNRIIEKLIKGNFIDNYKDFSDTITAFFSAFAINNNNKLILINYFETDTSKYEPPEPFTPEAQKERVIKELSKCNISLNSNQQIQLSSLSELYIKLISSKTIYSKDIESWVINEKKQFQKEHWNSSILEISSGYIFNSVDSTWNNLKGNRWSSYICGGMPLGKHFQFIGQIQYSNFIEKDTFQIPYVNYYHKSMFFVGGKILGGNENNRFSIEGSYTNLQSSLSKYNDSKMRFCIGFEYKLTEGLWAEVATGAYSSTYEGDKFKPMTIGSIKYALQKKRRYEVY